ncbi:MAG: exosortase/archaeosortase family protein, partial [bacterium]|nr:exosortase/archaeosortase family protein [bacterium]
MQNANIQEERDVRRHEEDGANPSPLSADPRPRAASQARRWSLLTLVIPLLAILPLFSFQAARMWADPARAYFPLVFVFVGLVVGWQLKQAEPTKFAVRRWIAIAFMVLAAIVFAWAVWSFSPWWAQVAGLVVFAAWALGTFGNLSSGVIALWTACLGTSLTLPFGWEQALPNTLHQFAAWCCSKCLDGLGVPHLWVGNLLELRDKIIVIDDACGAWSSVYALAFVVLALIIVQKRSMFVAVLSMLFVPLWVVVADFIQLSAITYAHENSGRDLASGWDFVLLDLLTFAFSVLCAALFSKTLSVLFEPVPVGDAEFGPLFASMNKLLCWPQPDPLEDIPPTDSDDLKHFQLLKREKLKRIEAKPKMNWWENLLSRWSVLLSCGMFVLAAALPSAVIATGQALPRFSRVSASAESLQRLEQISLPEKLGEWNLLANDLNSEEGIEDRPRQLEWQY